MCSLVRPYGLDAPRGLSSVIGTVSGWPYTVHDDENTRSRTSWRSIASSSCMVPLTLLS